MSDTTAAKPEAAEKPQNNDADPSKDRDLRKRDWREMADEDSRDSRRRSRSPDNRDRSYRNRSRDGRDRSRDRRGGRAGRGPRGARGRSRGRGARGREFGRYPRSDREYKAPKPNARFDNLPESKDHDEIRKQVEFYFSDANLPQDKFLLLQVEGPKNNAIDIKTIHSFSRMRRFQPYSEVVAALKDSKVLEVVDDSKIRRRVPLSEDISMDPHVNLARVDDRALPRSIYVKGFGDERDHLQIDIEALFEPYGPVSQVRMRRDRVDNHFKGSVFIEFSSETLKDDFMKLETKPKFEGKDLKFMTKAAYVAEKARLISEGKIRPQSPGGKDKRQAARAPDETKGQETGDEVQDPKTQTVSQDETAQPQDETAKPQDETTQPQVESTNDKDGAANPTSTEA